jgi:putative redox protein
MPGTMHVDLDQVGPSTLKATSGVHTVYVDRPVEKGGADRGLRGGEYLLVALGGCFSSHLLAAIAARNAAVTDVRVGVSGTLDGSPERFTALTMSVHARCDDDELLRKLVTIAERACQVVNTLRQSTPIEVVVTAAAGGSVSV